MRKNETGGHEVGVKGIDIPRIEHRWTWASDKRCGTCRHYDGSCCMIDDTRRGENYYCGSWGL